MARVLYISYDGLLEPLGQSQVFQYLRRLAQGHQITLVTYEKQADWGNLPKREALRQAARQAGIHWLALRYHKRPSALATAYDLLMGFFVCAYLVIRYRVHIVHARSYVPSVVALALKRVFRTRFIFDMRGFWADERIDGGIWRASSRIYRVAKWFEKQFLIHAHVVVSLTHASVRAMRDFPYLKDAPPRFEVIPTCTNLRLFHPREETSNGKQDCDRMLTLGYVGSAGTWYLFDHVLECFRILLSTHPRARLLIINRTDQEYIKERLEAFRIPPEHSEIKGLDYSEVASTMRDMSAGIFFYRPTFSKLATCPTKMGEFLACGLPCLTNAHVGDVAGILTRGDAGVVVDDFSTTQLEKAVRRLVELVNESDTKGRCLATAHRHFSLDEGVSSYRRIYDSLCHDTTQDSLHESEAWISLGREEDSDSAFAEQRSWKTGA